MQPKLIYFFGPDGVGKTTHARLILAYLRKKGHRATLVSIKQHHTLSYLLLKLIGNKNQKLSYYGFEGKLREKIRVVWKILEIISLIPAIIYRVFLPLMLNYLVVCDRYVLDTLVTLSYFLGEPKLLSGRLAMLLVKLIPKNSVLIHLDADAKTILRRKREEPLTLQLVNYYKITYKTLIRRWKLPALTIDTTKAGVQEVQRILLKLVWKQD